MAPGLRGYSLLGRRAGRSMRQLARHIPLTRKLKVPFEREHAGTVKAHSLATYLLQRGPSQRASPSGHQVFKHPNLGVGQHFTFPSKNC